MTTIHIHLNRRQTNDASARKTRKELFAIGAKTHPELGSRGYLVTELTSPVNGRIKGRSWRPVLKPSSNPDNMVYEDEGFGQI